MKLGQLMEYNMRNIFFGKSYTICAGETIPMDQECKALNSLFLLYANLRAIKI